MLGAIVGDIVGSIYERRNIKTKDFPLFGSRCSFTDDTVMTCAVAEAVMNGGKREEKVRAAVSECRLRRQIQSVAVLGRQRSVRELRQRLGHARLAVRVGSGMR